jgi:hypothetical protein
MRCHGFAVAIGDLVNATGVVDRNADSGLGVAVDDPEAFTWLAATRLSDAIGTAAPVRTRASQWPRSGVEAP